MRFVRLASRAAFFVCMVSIPQRTSAACISPRVITSGYSYVYTPGCEQNDCGFNDTSVNYYLLGAFWALGSGNPSPGVGIDNGTFPALGGWFYTYPGYPSVISSTWAADPGIDGCIDFAEDPQRCMVVLLSDTRPDNSRGVFAVLTKSRDSSGSYSFEQDAFGVIGLTPIPPPIVTLTRNADGSNCMIEASVSPPVEGPGVYLDGQCSSPLVGYRIRGVQVPGLLTSPPQSSAIADWPVLATASFPDATTVMLPVAPGTETFLAASLVFDGGFETPWVSVPTRIGSWETCNGIDDNCDGEIDDGYPQETFYRDADGDGYGSPGVTISACAAPSGYAANADDCDDTNPQCNTDCTDADGDQFCVTSDCDDSTPFCYADCTETDGDGVCPPLDCDDFRSWVYPGAAEQCNQIDDDCNGQIDDGVAVPSFYRDADGDGYGTAAMVVQACDAPPGYVANDADCDDSSAAIHPGSSDADCDLIDQNCSGSADEDFLSPPDGWIATSLMTPPGTLLRPRIGMSMVGTDDRVIEWGGWDLWGGTPTLTNTGAVYRPAFGSTDIWKPTSEDGAPTPRHDHTAVWTGSRMIVWGGADSSPLATGGRYDPTSNAWTPTSTAPNVPAARFGHTAVWTGSKMIVWGGTTSGGVTSTGGIYDPASDSWTTMSGIDAPAARAYHTAVWTGTEMIVWGGQGTGSIHLASGGRFDPAANTWSATAMPVSPLAARREHTAVWTGTQMVVWGGWDDTSPYSDGAIYQPDLNAWVWGFDGLPTVSARHGHTAIWDGVDGLMVVWGGLQGPTLLGDGGTYDPAGHVWTALPSAGAPSARAGHAAAWLPGLREMLVWGAVDPPTGGRIVVRPFTCGEGACELPSRYTCTAGSLGYGCPVLSPPSGVPSLTGAKSGPDMTLSWSAVGEATGYDVVRGGLSALRNSAGDFAVATTACLGDDLAVTTLQDGVTPPSSDGAWYLIRPIHVCNGNGSYDDETPSQVGSRDAEIAASAAPCP